MLRENKDFIYVSKAKGLDYKDPMKRIIGLFIGTNNYLIFIPSKTESIEMSYTTTTTTTETFFLAGESIDEFVSSKIEEFKTLEELEQVLINEIIPRVEGASFITLSDIGHIKVKGGWLNNSIIYKVDANKKFGWKLFALSFGKRRKDVLEFFCRHKKNINR